MKNQFETHINQNLSFLNESKLLIAISGGLDSVVLTHLCKKLQLNFALAHCNFNLRGIESDSDEDFVLELAENLNLEIFIESFETEDYAIKNKISIQMAARELRYNWFYDLANNLGFDYVLTAHHADDNLETVLINLTRGTGLKGLTGIPIINDKTVRPLLPFSREELEVFARKNKIKWQEDSSNASNKYLRNKLRHEVIPILKEINPDLLQNFKTTLENLKETSGIVNDSIRNLKAQAQESSKNGIRKYRISELQQLNNPKAYLYELFKNYGFAEWNDIVKLLDAQSGKQVFSATHRLLKDRKYLILAELDQANAKNENKCHIERSPIVRTGNRSAIIEDLEIKNTEKTIQTPIGILSFKETDAISEVSKNRIYIDKKRLKYPLKLRKWKTGDYFYPFGMTGKKKLSKYFKDEKLSLIDKEQVWVLCSGNQIVWIVGWRADERFRVTDETKTILTVRLE